MLDIILTDEQNKAVDMIKDWYVKEEHQTFILAGLAGTGKTTVLKYIRECLCISNIAYCSYTGKAARVMTNKGTPATTIHSLIYEAKEYIDVNGKRQVSFELKESLGSVELIIVDECSMIGKSIQQDLESFGIDILYVGDHGQLPPISDQVSNLMLTPNVRLETIHRQALDNPIIWCANRVRQGKPLSYGKYGTTVLKTTRDKINVEILSRADQILCGKNITRTKINDDMRNFYGFKSIFPEENDKLICLQNNKKNGLVNGMTGKCKYFNDKKYNMDFINDEGEQFLDLTVDCTIFKKIKSDKYFSHIDKFDFGYAITVHKFQGSESNNIIVFEEQFGDNEFHAKWLYTAITRSSEKLIIVS